MAREVRRCGGRVRVGLRLVLQRVGPGLAWPAERCEPARSHKDRSDQVQGRERHRLATTAMANLLQGCNSLGAVNSELSHSENTSGGGGRASIRNAYLLVLFVLSARRSGIAIGRDEHFLSIFRGGRVYGKVISATPLHVRIKLHTAQILYRSDTVRSTVVP